MIFAGLGVSESAAADELHKFNESLTTGLRKRGIHVITLSTDGTVKERRAQDLFCKLFGTDVISCTFSHPSRYRNDIEITIPLDTASKQVAITLQDSEHALKTFRNNLFSGARVLTLGEHVAMYGQVHKLVQEPESPLLICDVIKLNKQDDRAAIRLFSAAMLNHIIQHHPEWKGLACYLFVFGELVDTYRNRSISHSNRLKMVFRAQFFLEHWRLFLRSSDYKEDRHYISQDAHEIAMNLIDGFLSLVLIHRDHLPASPPSSLGCMGQPPTSTYLD